jgi:hypothetical protein
MHLYITGANISFITIILQTMVVRLLPIMRTPDKLWRTVIRRREPQKSIVQRIHPLPVPLQVPLNLLLLVQNLPDALFIAAVTVFAHILQLALFAATLQVRRVLGQQLFKVHCNEKTREKPKITIISRSQRSGRNLATTQKVKEIR